MKKILYSIYTLTTISVLFSCKTNLETEPVKSGTADFTRFVAIGNSLTSGYTDGALSKQGQENCFPKMMAQQFSLAGGGEFKIPYMNDGGGNDGGGNPRRVLGYVIPCNSSAPTVSPILDPKGSTAFNNVAANGPYNLVGVPGARAVYGAFGSYSSPTFNPFLARFCKTPGSSSLLSEALRINPTFFSLWLGNNDVLLYATNGATPTSDPINPGLSDTMQLRMVLTQMVDSLTKNGAKGVIANIPDVTSVPFFTTIPWNGAVLDTATAANLNALYTSLSISNVTWHTGANGFVIADASLPTGMRHAISGELILLTTPSDSLKCGQWGISPAKPLASKYVLTLEEKSKIQNYTAIYNSSIANIATKYNLAFVNMNAFMTNFKSGIVYNGVSLSPTFITGGAMSLDGVHPNARGYALIANEFIKSINLKYNASIPYVDPTKYNGIIFP